ncbi:MAG: MGH1-like glycoside hydrolase domain-containing protein [Chloroflexota bacterium]
MADADTPYAQPSAAMPDPEERRLAEARDHGIRWYRWGPYLAERAWGTVREDYSADGAAWDDFPHDHARSRAYRWNEDGLLGISDDQGLLCFGLTLWNGADPILKERLFGLTGVEGHHGEDVKEYYFYLDNTPTHSYMQALYKYPQRAFPYAELVARNRRSRAEPEYELLDTGVFADDRYFDVTITYAKVAPDDMFIRIAATNRGHDPAPLHLLPTLWFRNTWSWDRADGPVGRPYLQADGPGMLRADHPQLGVYWLHCDGAPELLFTENETNGQRLWGVPNAGAYVKDGIDEAVVHGRQAAVNPAGTGTKAAAHYALTIAAGATETVLLRLAACRHAAPYTEAEATVAERQAEADHFYASLANGLTADERLVQRQAFAGLLWSKQWYHYDVGEWLEGDPIAPPPPQRRHGRNRDWRHFNTEDILSMPDTWEYPWFASWDLAFHCLPLALIDPEFAKAQLVLQGREWYQHPNGQFAAYEWAFGDVNPPVHAWAAWRVYKIEQRRRGVADRPFLERVFHKLLLNFTWWVNRKDAEGRNVFQGGFLGLDNIGVFDRSATLPTGGHLDQSDGTAWMGMYCLNMLTIALELARENAVYEDVATKFFEHFLYIAAALNDVGGEGMALWDEQDEFFYDVLHLPNDTAQRLKVRSLVGLIPLLAVETIEPDLLAMLPQFAERLEWFLAHRPDLAGLVSRWQEPGMGARRLVALVRGHRLKCLLRRMLDPQEFLSAGGVRSLSHVHAEHPYALHVDGVTYTVDYQPGESTSALFGGNSNWRGPVWFPINYLLIEALQKFHHYYGDDFLVECPTGSGRKITLQQIAAELSKRLSGLFLRDTKGRRPVFGANERWQTDPHWRDALLFSEYFHGDSGAGLGASHQTGWTALVAKLLEQAGRARPAAASGGPGD